MDPIRNNSSRIVLLTAALCLLTLLGSIHAQDTTEKPQKKTTVKELVMHVFLGTREFPTDFARDEMFCNIHCSCSHFLLDQNSQQTSSPVVETEGENGLLTCVTNNLGNYTLIWKFNKQVLTANEQRVTTDERVSILHDEGGDVFVLAISNLTVNDTGLYVCEANTEPPTRSFHQLTVLPYGLSAELRPPPPSGSTDTPPTANSTNIWGYSTEKPLAAHDFSPCCTALNVSPKCLGFCSIQNILEGKAGINPTECEDQFPRIVQCMADGRNHGKCCRDAGVPDVCQDMCVGEYRMQTDDIRSQVACADFTAPTLACIAEGISILPGRPEELSASHVTSTSIGLDWKRAKTVGKLDDNDIFEVQYVKVRAMSDGVFAAKEGLSDSPHGLVKIDTVKDTTKHTLTNLDPFSLYNITVTAHNQHGTSLPSYYLLVLTRPESDSAKWERPDDKAVEDATPSIPDTRNCCLNKNISSKMCINKFCDPSSVQSVTIPDMMICAPWASELFSCLYDGEDHTQCCDANDVPSICGPICAGNITNLNFRHFGCIEYMPVLAHCALKKFGVLPSEPLNFRFSNVGTNMGLLHWDIPEKHSASILAYRVYYKKMNPIPGELQIKETKHDNFILENLDSDSSYEAYVRAVNAHGLGDESIRIVFRTAMARVEDKEDIDNSKTTYDPASCCENVGVQPLCQPICAFNASMTAIRRLSLVCLTDFAKISKCATGGRDHLPCCERRGVPPECQLLCQGIQSEPSASLFTQCMPYIGNIVTCLEEGSYQLPPPVVNFHALFVADTKITLAWDAVEADPAVQQYEVFYKQVQPNSSVAEIFQNNQQINISDTSVIVSGLPSSNLHQFFVVARNAFGTSMPSSLLTVNISRAAWTGSDVPGLPTPPHAAEVTNTTTNSLELAWTAPVITHPEDTLKYRIYYRKVKSRNVTITVETSANSVTLRNLEPNTQYVIYLSTLVMNKDAATKESQPSETLIAWTFPIVPAFAESPVVQPSGGIREGSSMQVLCIAMGSPMPKVTLYIGGHSIRSQVSRHMVTTVHNVTKAMNPIGCLADNGYGTPMQASRSIDIIRKPELMVPKTVTGIEGDSLVFSCHVDGFPVPMVALGKNKDSIASSNRIKTAALTSKKDPATVSLHVNITKVLRSDAGVYYCKANNSVGSVYKEFRVGVIPLSTQNQRIDTESCCAQQNVSSTCMGLCALSIDLDFLLYRPECFSEFDKLMFCAADGSDHRHCCSNSGVPAACLNWCRGIAVEENSEFCALTHARKIAKCFVENESTLPSPPLNIRVTPLSGHSARATWDPPQKNPHTVQMYRLLYRRQGTKRASKVDTTDTSVVIDNLEPATLYELVVKAGNSKGTSQLTTPLQFVTADKFFIETSGGYSNSALPSIVGVLVALVLIAVVGVLLYAFFRRGKRITSGRNSPNLTPRVTSSTSSSVSTSFENPFSQASNGEMSLSQLQASEGGLSPNDEVSTAVDDETETDYEPSPEEMSSEKKKFALPKMPKMGKASGQQGFQRFE